MNSHKSAKSKKTTSTIISTTKDLSRDYICPICLELLNEAHVTKCGHTFCYKCITLSLAKSNRCPQCNYTCDSFFPNFLVNEMVTKYRNLKLEEINKVSSDANELKNLVARTEELNAEEIDDIMKLLEMKKNNMSKLKMYEENKLLQELFTKLLETKRLQFEKVKHELEAIESDYAKLESMIDSSNRTAPETSKSEEPPAKKIAAFNSIDLGKCEHVSRPGTSMEERKKKINLRFQELEKNYFDKCLVNTRDSDERIEDMRETLNKFTDFTSIRTLVSMNFSRESALQNIVTSIELDKDKEYFAIAGVARKVKIFDFQAMVKDPFTTQHSPVNEIECTTKISNLCWNSYFKTMLASSDYEGSVFIWDAFLGRKINHFNEHEKRCWSIDFNHVDINILGSCGDDCRVKIWAANMPSSICTINTSANICSIKFNPKSLYHFAFGSADYKTYYYDLRNTATPLQTYHGHNKAVSYVRFMNADQFVSLSTDGTVKLWNTSNTECLRSFQGHVNAKHFVGLTTNDDYIACGSEDNSLYVYYKAIHKHVLQFYFQKEKDDNSEFVSSLCWCDKTNVIVAANSSGFIKLLELV